MRLMSQKRYEDLCFTDDFLFCKILSTDLALTKELLELILQVGIRKISIVQPQKYAGILADSKSVRFDVYVEDTKDSVYDIEMQTTDKGELPQRSRYYQDILDLNMLEKGMIYTKLHRSFVIFITTFDPFQQGRYIYTFENRCFEDPNFLLKDSVRRVFVNADGHRGDVSPKMKHFLSYLKSQTATDTFTKRLDEAVRSARLHKEWRQDYMTLNMKLNEARSEGRAEGRAAGRTEGRLKTLYTLVHLGKVSVEDAAGLAGMSVSEFERYMSEKPTPEES